MTSEFQALLKRVIEYDPATGVFRWKDPGANRMKLGDVAGTVRTDGYCLVCIAGTTFLAHRLAWIYSFGHWPKLDLDHINGDPSDNRLVNLREVDHTSNMQNRKRQTNNLSGAPGVYWDSKRERWIAAIHARGVRYHLGSFKDFVVATEKYAAAKKHLHISDTRSTAA
jgi:hypothetical protein